MISRTWRAGNLYDGPKSSRTALREEAHVLLVERLVEAVLRASSCSLAAAGMSLSARNGPPGASAHHEERERRDHPQRRDDQQQAPAGRTWSRLADALDAALARRPRRPASRRVCQSWSIHTCVSGWMSSAVVVDAAHVGLHQLVRRVVVDRDHRALVEQQRLGLGAAAASRFAGSSSRAASRISAS